MRKPVLIDVLVNDYSKVQREINGKWYIAKPIPYGGFSELLVRLYHAWLIVTEKATAYQHMEDR